MGMKITWPWSFMSLGVVTAKVESQVIATKDSRRFKDVLKIPLTNNAEVFLLI